MTKCPICGQYEFEEDFDVCPICEWQHDRVQENEPDFSGGANELSLNKYKMAWRVAMKTQSETTTKTVNAGAQ